MPAWYLLLGALSPTGAYNHLVQWVLVGEGAVVAQLGGQPPAYLHPALFVALLLAWGLLPLAGGYLSFRRADLS